MESSAYSLGSIFALFILPALIIAASVILAALLKEEGE
jgi:hypothetical protein